MQGLVKLGSTLSDNLVLREEDLMGQLAAEGQEQSREPIHEVEKSALKALRAHLRSLGGAVLGLSPVPSIPVLHQRLCATIMQELPSAPRTFILSRTWELGWVEVQLAVNKWRAAAGVPLVSEKDYQAYLILLNLPVPPTPADLYRSSDPRPGTQPPAVAAAGPSAYHPTAPAQPHPPPALPTQLPQQPYGSGALSFAASDPYSRPFHAAQSPDIPKGLPVPPSGM